MTGVSSEVLSSGTTRDSGMRIHDMISHRSLQRPEHLDNGHWLEVENLERRLTSAYEDGDRALVIGTAKDLIEAVAKIALETRGELSSGSIKFPRLIVQAHATLQRESGDSLTSDPHVHRVSEAALSVVSDIAMAVVILRNKYGTGHGRVRYQELLDEHSELALDGALMWSRWALRRISGSPRFSGE